MDLACSRASWVSRLAKHHGFCYISSTCLDEILQSEQCTVLLCKTTDIGGWCCHDRVAWLEGILLQCDTKWHPHNIVAPKQEHEENNSQKSLSFTCKYIHTYMLHWSECMTKKMSASLSKTLSRSIQYQWKVWTNFSLVLMRYIYFKP